MAGAPPELQGERNPGRLHDTYVLAVFMRRYPSMDNSATNCLSYALSLELVYVLLRGIPHSVPGGTRRGNPTRACWNRRKAAPPGSVITNAA